MTNEWDVFVFAWARVGWYAAWHENWRRRGHKVYFNKSGTVIYHPDALRYCDGI